MERSELLRVLGDTPVEVSCREALENGAPYEIWDGESPAARTVNIYARRERNASRVGQPSIGFAEAVEALRRYRGEALRIGYVDARPLGGYYMQIFLTPDSGSVIACFGILPSGAE